MVYLIIAFLSFIFTVFLTPQLINFLVKKDLVEYPDGNDRKIHTTPIPRMGGVIIFSLVTIITFAFYHDIFSKKYFIIGAIIVFALGLWDDLRPLKWYTKFIFQSISAFLLIISLNVHGFTRLSFLGLTLPVGLNYIVLFVLIVGILNSFNLLDGLDGLVTGFALIISSMCFLLSFGGGFVFLPILAAATAGTTLGFLKFNANPARIFLGDSGSFILGYFIAGLVLVISGESSIYSNNIVAGLSDNIDLTFVFIALAVPIADTLRVLFVRLKNNKHPFSADNNHIHHIIYSKKIQHKTVVFLIHGFSSLFALLAIYYVHSDKFYALIIFTVMLLILLFVDPIIEFIIRKEHLLAYGRAYKKIPVILPDIYKKYLLPVVSIVLAAFLFYLVIKEISENKTFHSYFLLILIPAFVYSSFALKRENYYAELLVFLNFILFFIVTGLNGFFYKMYPFPVISQININQLFIIILSAMIMFFILFKERIANVRSHFLTGTDLTIAIFIAFVYVAVQLTDMNQPYLISDTLLRSFLLFLFYKIIVVSYPRFHLSLYYASFAAAVIAVMKSVF